MNISRDFQMFTYFLHSLKMRLIVPKSSPKLISSKLEFLIDKIFVVFGGRVY